MPRRTRRQASTTVFLILQRMGHTVILAACNEVGSFPKPVDLTLQFEGQKYVSIAVAEWDRQARTNSYSTVINKGYFGCGRTGLDVMQDFRQRKGTQEKVDQGLEKSRSGMAINTKFAVFCRSRGPLLSVTSIAVPELSCHGQFGKFKPVASPCLTQFYYFRPAQSYLSTSSVVSLHLVFPILQGKRKYRCRPAFSVFLLTVNLTYHRSFTVRWIYLTSSQERQHQPAVLTCPSSPNGSQVHVGYSLGPLPGPLHYFQGRELDLTDLSSGTGVSKLSSEPVVGALCVSLL